MFCVVEFVSFILALCIDILLFRILLHERFRLNLINVNKQYTVYELPNTNSLMTI